MAPDHRRKFCDFCSNPATHVVKIDCGCPYDDCDHDDYFTCAWCTRTLYYMHNDSGDGLNIARLYRHGASMILREDADRALIEVELLLNG